MEATCAYQTSVVVVKWIGTHSEYDERNASADIQNAMDIRIIKTDEQYQKALEEVGRLAEKDPVPESTDGARLELLANIPPALLVREPSGNTR